MQQQIDAGEEGCPQPRLSRQSLKAPKRSNRLASCLKSVKSVIGYLRTV